MTLLNKNFENQTFKDIPCSTEDMNHGEFSHCNFKKCDFSGYNFSGTTFADCSFVDCNLSNIKVNNASFQNVLFENCKILGIVFSTVDPLLITWVYKKCNISFCDFSNLDMKESQFLSCDITESDFIKANLTGSDFSESSLALCKFQNTNLEKVNFVGARNYYINPVNNKLKHAKFSYPEVLSLLDDFGIKVEY